MAGWAVWVVYRLPLVAGTVVGTVVVVVLEVLFRKWGIFIGNGWRVWHSMIAFPPYFLLIYWYRSVAEQHGVADGWVRAGIRVSLALWWSHFVGMVAYWITAGLIFRVAILPTFARNQTVGAILTTALPFNLAILWAMAVQGRERMVRMLWSAAGLLVVGWFWTAAGLWQFRAPWNLFVHTAVQVATIYVAALCDDMIGRWAEVPGGNERAPL
ncbi:MAG TPA: hypothetical protein VD973_24370 [Symbiobacteriaceae bacterium]|nr:hypothetical protein [Symbiobacteriaceae bacterium]